MSVLADGRRVSVINAHAGAGKTRVLAEVGRAWSAAGLGRVIGITPSQSARNTLAAGVPESCNSAQFLGHLPGWRGARGPVPVGPCPLFLLDEASMLSGPDLVDLIRIAETVNGKIILAGDTAQLQSRRPDRLHPQRPWCRGGEPGRGLANGDLLRIEAVTPGGLLVRRALDADPATGQRRWTDQRFLFTDFASAELGYAVTDHVAQGRTVHTGLAVISGTEDRQHAYVALTRGTDSNMAYVFTVPPKLAGPAPGPRPAPELARYDKITAGRAAAPGADTRAGDPLTVLAAVLENDGEQLSAVQTRQRALAGADHLAFLHAIWADRTTPAREQRYAELLAALPSGYRQEPGHQAKWLWRTLRAAELAGLDAGRVLADAAGERDLTGARDVPSVIGARLRHRTGALIPRPAGPWSAQLPEIADPERRAFAAQIAVMMDERKERIGEHAAEHSLPWAVSALGPVPADPAGRVVWRRRAASIGAWRELSGHDDPADPIGPEPAGGDPDIRAAWHEALAALGPVNGPDVRGMAAGYQAVHGAYRERETVFAAVMADRVEWDKATRQQRHLAIAADAELRRRYPDQHYPPLRSAEPQPPAQAQRDELTFTAGEQVPRTGRWITDLAAQHHAFAEKLVERHHQAIRAEDPALTFPSWAGARQDAILQPPKPQIQPSERILERITQHDLDMEAAE